MGTMQGQLEPGVLELPNLNIWGLMAAVPSSPRWLTLAQPFPPASVLLTSGIGWVHLA